MRLHQPALPIATPKRHSLLSLSHTVSRNALQSTNLAARQPRSVLVHGVVWYHSSQGPA